MQLREPPVSVFTSKGTMPSQVAATLNWTLGPYRIAREIGRGHFGTVYEATNTTGERIALKLVPIEGADAEEKVAAERGGAALQQRFSRASRGLVPEVLDHRAVDPYYVIAMELVSGQPLTTLIRAGRIAAGVAATIAEGICRFLIAAHEFTADIDGRSRTILVHGDLKPAHILLLADGSIRVLDFGIAKALAARNAATTNLWSSVDYASPERLESGRVTEHVDFWALGVILFEMVSGVRPYSRYEHDRSRLETAIRRQEPRLRVPDDIDPRLTAVIEKLLAPQIENRYQSARQIAADLQAFRDGTAVVAFVEACRANQATIRSPAAADTHRGESNRGAGRLPRGRDARAGSTPLDEREVIAATEPVPSVARAAERPESSPRSCKSWVAAVLSFLAPGLGQIYNGDYLRGVFWLIVTPGFWIGSAGLLGWPFHLIAAYTAYLRARPPAPYSVRSPSRPMSPGWLARMRAS